MSLQIPVYVENGPAASRRLINARAFSLRAPLFSRRGSKKGRRRVKEGGNAPRGPPPKSRGTGAAIIFREAPQAPARPIPPENFRRKAGGLMEGSGEKAASLLTKGSGRALTGSSMGLFPFPGRPGPALRGRKVFKKAQKI